MVNKINRVDQNTQPIDKNLANQNQLTRTSRKPKVSFWIISLIALALLLTGILVKILLKPTTQENFQQSNVTQGKIYIHKANTASQLIDPVSSNYQQIKNITSRIISSTIAIPTEDRVKVTLLVNQEDFNHLEQNNYIEIQPDQIIKDNIENMGYDKLLFILSGPQSHGGMIFGHNTVYKGESNPHSSWWPWWGPYNTNLFWSLGEFLGVPSPTPQPLNPTLRQRQEAESHQTPQTENQEVILAELQRLDIEVKDRWEQREITIPSDPSDANWGLKREICEEGGYNSTVYAGKSLLFTSYLTNEIWNDKESLLVWVISDGSKVVCVYKSVLPGSNLAPGIFSVKGNPNIKKR